MIITAFVVIQLLGAVLLTYVNIHERIWPAFFFVLLLPGILVGFVHEMSYSLLLVFAIPINALTWYLFFRAAFRD